MNRDAKNQIFGCGRNGRPIAMNKLILPALLGALVGSLCTALAQDPGELIWSAPVSSRSSPAIGPDGTVYAGSLSAFTPAGSNKWTIAIAPGSGSPAVGGDGTVYTGSDDARLYAITPNGAVKWTFDAAGSVGSTPALGTDGTVYFYSGAQKLFAVSPDGVKKWDFYLGGVYIAPSPVVAADGTILVGADANRLVAVNPDGTKKWEFAAGGVVAMPAAITANGNICLAAGEFGGRFLYLLDREGKEIWRNGTNDLVTSPAIDADGTIYVGSFNPTRVHAIDPSTGLVKWSSGGGYNVQFALYSTAAIAKNGLIYYGGAAVNSSTYFYALNPQGTTNWQYFVGDPVVGSPAVACDGTIFFAASAALSGGATLYALKGNSPLADSPWPMYRQNPRHTGKVEKPVLKEPKKRSDAGFEFQLYPQELGLAYTIEASTNLNTWTALTNFIATTLPMPVVDSSASNSPMRFYRARTP